MIKQALIRLAVIGAVLATFAAAFAVPNESLMQQSALLITQPNVGLDLKLTQMQATECGQIMAAYRSTTERIEAGPVDQAETRQAGLDKARLDMESKLLALLTPAQMNRLKQIVIQQVGTDALQEPAIAQDLGLTSAQRAKIKSIYDGVRNAQDAYQNALGEALEKLGDPGTEEAALKAYAVKQEAVIKSMKPREKQYLDAKAVGDRQMLATLTPAQRNKWVAMHGKILKPG